MPPAWPHELSPTFYFDTCTSVHEIPLPSPSGHSCATPSPSGAARDLTHHRVEPGGHPQRTAGHQPAAELMGAGHRAEGQPNSQQQVTLDKNSLSAETHS